MRVIGLTRTVVLVVGLILLSTPGLWAAQDLLVGVGGNTIQRYTYNTTTSAWDLVGNFVTGTGVWDFCYGPDQNGDGFPELYVSDNGAGVIRWYDGKTGGTSGTTYATATGDEPCGIAFVGDTLYVALDKPNTVVKRNSSGTLETVVSDFYDPRHLTAGPDRTGDGVEDLYIAGGNDENVNENWFSRVCVYGYYPDEEAWQSKVFTTGEPDGGAEHNYNFGLAWGPDKTGDGVGDLYTADGRRKVIEVMDGVTGAYWGDLTAGFGFPFHLLWGPDGNLYINDYFAEVAIHDITGAKIGWITGSSNLGLAFMPEATEPPATPVVGITNKSVLDSLTGTVEDDYIWVLWGKVSNRTAGAFKIDDGSGVIIDVVATANAVADGDHVTVKGTLSGAGTTTPTLTAQSVTKYNP